MKSEVGANDEGGAKEGGGAKRPAEVSTCHKSGEYAYGSFPSHFDQSRNSSLCASDGVCTRGLSNLAPLGSSPHCACTLRSCSVYSDRRCHPSPAQPPPPLSSSCASSAHLALSSHYRSTHLHRWSLSSPRHSSLAQRALTYHV